tara:strand:- start:458 stop:835 length:378 start_codon:yes stop_codon:yes gene_type:complete
MGTTVDFIRSKDRPNPAKMAEKSLNRVDGWKVLASNKEYVGKDFGFYKYAVYSAVDTGDEVFGCVSVIGIKKYPYSWDYEVSEKIIGEDEGPYYFGANRKVLSLLTSTDSKYAKEWRDKCYEEVA